MKTDLMVKFAEDKQSFTMTISSMRPESRPLTTLSMLLVWNLIWMIGNCGNLPAKRNWLN